MKVEASISNLIAALQIFLKYGNINYPTHCEHDILRVHVAPEKVSMEDKKELSKLGFDERPEDECFTSFRYGSS